MKQLIQILFIFSAINAIAISWLIYKTKNGWMRKLLFFYFSATAFALVVRFLSWRFGWEGQIVSISVLLPVSITLFALTLFFYSNYKR